MQCPPPLTSLSLSSRSEVTNGRLQHHHLPPASLETAVKGVCGLWTVDCGYFIFLLFSPLRSAYGMYTAAAAYGCRLTKADLGTCVNLKFFIMKYRIFSRSQFEFEVLNLTGIISMRLAQKLV